MDGPRIYRNTRTGVCIQTPCVCAGEDWEEVRPAERAPAEPAAQEPEKTPPKRETKRRK